MVFLSVRVLHVVMAAVWIGSTVFVSTLLVPAIEASGPSGGQVMMRISKRGINAYMGVLGGTTALTGLYLLWRFLGGFAGEFGAIEWSHAAIAFTVGGVSGILAGVIGGSIVARSADRAADLTRQASGMTDGAAKAALLQRVPPLRHRMKIGSRAVVALQMLALVLMAIGHYV